MNTHSRRPNLPYYHMGYYVPLWIVKAKYAYGRRAYTHVISITHDFSFFLDNTTHGAAHRQNHC